MDGQHSIDLASEALNTVLVLAAPVLATVLVVGLLASLIQTVTQIQDPSLSQIPKLVAVAIVLSVGLPWLLNRLVDYSTGVFSDIPKLFGGG
jgi:flagellar biosynthetic protein FliQ